MTTTVHLYLESRPALGPSPALHIRRVGREERAKGGKGNSLQESDSSGENVHKHVKMQGTNDEEANKINKQNVRREGRQTGLSASQNIQHSTTAACRTTANCLARDTSMSCIGTGCAAATYMTTSSPDVLGALPPGLNISGTNVMVKIYQGPVTGMTPATMFPMQAIQPPSTVESPSVNLGVGIVVSNEMTDEINGGRRIKLIYKRINEISG